MGAGPSTTRNNNRGGPSSTRSDKHNVSEQTSAGDPTCFAPIWERQRELIRQRAMERKRKGEAAKKNSDSNPAGEPEGTQEGTQKPPGVFDQLIEHGFLWHLKPATQALQAPRVLKGDFERIVEKLCDLKPLPEMLDTEEVHVDFVRTQHELSAKATAQLKSMRRHVVEHMIQLQLVSREVKQLRLEMQELLLEAEGETSEP